MNTNQDPELHSHDLYVVVSQTNTIVSRIIRLFTKDKYNHASISLNEELTDMYSFGRKYSRSPIPGGFIQENIHKKVFKNHPETKMAVYKLSVTDEQYAKILDMLKEMKYNPRKYQYNILGLFLAAAHKERKAQNKFYCSEFVKHVLVNSNVVKEKELPNICKPMCFRNIPSEIIFEGKLTDYGKR